MEGIERESGFKIAGGLIGSLIFSTISIIVLLAFRASSLRELGNLLPNVVEDYDEKN
ncbi:hypothetical protein BJ742DRAFT_781402 [Cladochytrium replicatum]|nr:hypothetical protein BJ742DRAFT_781402 [Cladochytrium replicatum]